MRLVRKGHEWEIERGDEGRVWELDRDFFSSTSQDQEDGLSDFFSSQGGPLVGGRVFAGHVV